MQIALNKVIKMEKSVFYLIALNIVLAASAFVKDIFMARYFGTTAEADAFTLGFFIPDTIGNNLIAAGLGVTSIPIFSRLVARNKYDDLKQVFRRLVVVVLISTVVISIVCMLLAGPILSVLLKGHQPSSFRMVYADYLLMIPMVIFFPLTMMFSALLQTKQQFVIPAFSPILFNVLWFVGLAYCLSMKVGVHQGQYLLSTWLTVSAGLSVCYFLPFLKRFWREYGTNAARNRKLRLSPYLLHLFRQWLPYVLTLLFAQSLLLVERYLAAGLETGTVAALNYSYRLVQFPVWVVVAAISTVLLPRFSKAISLKRHREAYQQMQQALLWVILLSVFSSLMLFLFRTPIVSLLFERGAFDDHSVQLTSSILRGYCWSILGQSMTFLCLRYYTARSRLRIPLIISIVSFIVSASFDWLEVPTLGASALGYGAAIGAILAGVIYLSILKKRNGGLK